MMSMFAHYNKLTTDQRTKCTISLNFFVFRVRYLHMRSVKLTKISTRAWSDPMFSSATRNPWQKRTQSHISQVSVNAYIFLDLFTKTMGNQKTTRMKISENVEVFSSGCCHILYFFLYLHPIPRSPGNCV